VSFPGVIDGKAVLTESLKEMLETWNNLAGCRDVIALVSHVPTKITD
jgi:hypothetical protein